MRFVNVLLIGAVLGLLFSCGQPSKIPVLARNEADSIRLLYSKASGYFVRNDFFSEGLTLTTIDSKEKLEKIFGYATVMGEGGSATPVNFENQFALAAVYSATDLDVKIESSSLFIKNDTLNVLIDLVMGQKKSFQSRPFTLLIVEGRSDSFGAIKTLVNTQTAD